MKEVTQTHRGDPLAIYTRIESLCCTNETKIALHCVSVTSQKNKCVHWDLAPPGSLPQLSPLPPLPRALCASPRLTVLGLWLRMPIMTAQGARRVHRRWSSGPGLPPEEGTQMSPPAARTEVGLDCPTQGSGSETCLEGQGALDSFRNLRSSVPTWSLRP